MKARVSDNRLWTLFWGAVFVALLVIIVPLLFVLSKPSEQGNSESQDPHLRIENGIIYLDDKEVYRFVPVEGGPAKLRGLYNVEIEGKDTDVYRYKNEYIDGFLIGDTPVTLELWNYVVGGDLPEDFSIVPGRYVSNILAEDWYRFINSLSEMTGRHFRLPTVDEWEFAARGGIHSSGFKYAGSDNIDEVAFYKDNYFQNPGNVFILGKMKKANELGLYDMSGGVLELTSSKMYDLGTDLSASYNQYLERIQRGETISEDDLLWILLNSNISMGGDFTKTAIECALDYVPTSGPFYTGARLIMEF
jgi:formylglycine-generating enzyme required for sulfatase activity